MSVIPGPVLDAAEIRDEIRQLPLQGAYIFRESGDTEVMNTTIYNTSNMKQTLNEGTSGKWEKKEIRSL